MSDIESHETSSSDRRGTTRRVVLTGILTAVTGYWLHREVGPVVSRRHVEDFLRQLLTAVPIPDPIGVGQEYLALDPWNQDPPSYMERVLGSLPLAEAESIEEIVAAFREKLQNDFVQGEVLHLNGWFVSRTEAELCALLAIDRHRGPLMPAAPVRRDESPRHGR